MEQAGRGLLEGLRGQTQTLSHSAMLIGEDAVSPAAAVHQLDSKSHRDSGAQGAFTSTGKETKLKPCTEKQVLLYD